MHHSAVLTDIVLYIRLTSEIPEHIGNSYVCCSLSFLFLSLGVALEPVLDPLVRETLENSESLMLCDEEEADRRLLGHHPA